MENGTKEGHQILMEARETVLKVLPIDDLYVKNNFLY